MITHAIKNLTQGQREFLGDHRVMVRCIYDQQRNYSGAQSNAVAAADVRIVGDDLTTGAGNLFFLGDNLGAHRQSSFIRFATR